MLYKKLIGKTWVITDNNNNIVRLVKFCSRLPPTIPLYISINVSLKKLGNVKVNLYKKKKTIEQTLNGSTESKSEKIGGNIGV